MLYSGKSGCSRAKEFVCGQKWFHLVKVVVFGQSGCIWANVIVLGQSGCNWAKVDVFGKVIVLKQKLLY